MRGLGRIAIVVTLGVGVAVAAFACSGAPEDGSPGHGIVQGVDAEGRKVILDHGDIPGLMKAMTMTFEVAPGVALEGLEAGAEVDFKVKEEGGTYTVTEIRRSGP